MNALNYIQFGVIFGMLILIGMWKERAARLQRLVMSLTERVHVQSHLLSRCAEKSRGK